MRHLVRSLAAISALAVASVAHAETFSGTASFTDTSTTHNNDYSFTGSFANPSFSFSGGVGTVYTDALTIYTTSVSGRNGSASDDTLSVSVGFTLPNPANGGFTGTGVFQGVFLGTDNTIHWTNNIQTVTFTDGSSLQLSLPDFDYGTFLVFPTGSHTEDLSIKVLSTAAPTPEPSSLALLGTGVLGLAGVVRRKLSV
jgi:hypothetical protein